MQFARIAEIGRPLSFAGCSRDCHGKGTLTVTSAFLISCVPRTLNISSWGLQVSRLGVGHVLAEMVRARPGPYHRRRLCGRLPALSAVDQPGGGARTGPGQAQE